jgi:hypothetical protein
MHVTSSAAATRCAASAADNVGKAALAAVALPPAAAAAVVGLLSGVCMYKTPLQRQPQSDEEGRVKSNLCTAGTRKLQHAHEKVAKCCRCIVACMVGSVSAGHHAVVPFTRFRIHKAKPLQAFESHEKNATLFLLGSQRSCMHARLHASGFTHHCCCKAQYQQNQLCKQTHAGPIAGLHRPRDTFRTA